LIYGDKSLSDAPTMTVRINRLMQLW